MAAWNIPLAIQGPKINSPMDTEARSISLKSAAAGLALKQQEQQEGDLKLQQQREDEADQKTIQQAMANSYDPETHTVDFDKVKEAVRPAVRLRNMQGLETLHATALKNTLSMDADKRAKLLAHNTALGNETYALLQTPQGDRQTAYTGARQRLIQSGDIKENDPDFPETIPDEMLSDNALKAHMTHLGLAASVQKLATDKAEEERKKSVAAWEKAKAEKEASTAASKDQQQKIEDAVRDHLKVTDQASHNEWLQGLDEDTRKRMPKVFDPKTTPDLLENMVLTSVQRDQKVERRMNAQSNAHRAAVAGGKAGLAARATDPTVEKEDQDAAKEALELLNKTEAKGLTENQQRVRFEKDREDQDADAKLFETYRDAETELWTKVQQYDDIVRGAKGDTVKDPVSGKDIPVEVARSRANGMRTRAQDKNASAKLILKKHGWGEFAGQAAQPGSPAAEKSAAAATARPLKNWKWNGKTINSQAVYRNKKDPTKFYRVTNVDEKTGKITTEPAEDPGAAGAQ